MKKVSLILGAVLLVLAGMLCMFSCGTTGNGPPAPFSFKVGPAAGGGGAQLPVGLGEAMTAAMSGQGTAELTDEELGQVMDALQGANMLKAGTAATAPICTAGSEACAVSGTISYAPAGNACTITFNNCDQGGGAVNGTMEVEVLSDELIRFSMDLTVNVPGMDPVPVQVEMFIYLVTANGYLVVFQVDATTYTVAGASNCSVTVTWDTVNLCYTVDATGCAGGDTFYSTCCLDEDTDTYDTCDADNPNDTDGKEADCDDAHANANPGITTEFPMEKALIVIGIALECADGIDNDCDGFIDLDDPDCNPAKPL